MGTTLYFLFRLKICCRGAGGLQPQQNRRRTEEARLGENGWGEGSLALAAADAIVEGHSRWDESAPGPHSTGHLYGPQSRKAAARIAALLPHGETKRKRARCYPRGGPSPLHAYCCRTAAHAEPDCDEGLLAAGKERLLPAPGYLNL